MPPTAPEAVSEVAVFRMLLPSGEPVQVQLVVDSRRDAVEAFLTGQDPVELEHAALNRPDCNSDEQGGFVAALLRELTERSRA